MHLGKIFFHVSTWTQSHGVNLPHAYSAPTQTISTHYLHKSSTEESPPCNGFNCTSPSPPAPALDTTDHSSNKAEIQSAVGGLARLQLHTLSSSWEVQVKVWMSSAGTSRQSLWTLASAGNGKASRTSNKQTAQLTFISEQRNSTEGPAILVMKCVWRRVKRKFLWQQQFLTTPVCRAEWGPGLAHRVCGGSPPEVQDWRQ